MTPPTCRTTALPSPTVSVTPPTLDALLTQCAHHHITVTTHPLPGTMRGAYHHTTRTITLRPGMPDWMTVPTLLHEMRHAWRGDDGHQAHRVEARIDRWVATRLLDVGRYAAAEALVGPAVGALAAELDVPAWVVVAYRDTLRTRSR